MEIDINNALLIAVKTTYGPCLDKYHEITEIIINLSTFIVQYLLRRPFLTTILFSIFLSFIITALLLVFLTIIGVLIFILVILLIEGFLLITFLVIVSMGLLNLFVIIIVVTEIKCKICTAP